MKTTLETLLKQITPLPWRMDKDARGQIIAGEKRTCVASNPRSGNDLKWVEQGVLSIIYAQHAANVLPALVEAAKEYMEKCGINQSISGHRDCDCYGCKIKAALQRAEQIDV